jgi:basic amino acid/polyamine antiporter, APA family
MEHRVGVEASAAASKGGLELPRLLGFGDVLGILVGNVIGSGIFIVPAAIAAQVGSPLMVLAVWLTGGILSFFGVLTLSELGAAYPRAGGMYVYLREAYGSFTGFLFGWTLFFVVDSGAIATLVVAFSSNYLPYFVPLSPFGMKAVALSLIAVLVAINYAGLRYGALLQNSLTVFKFGAILAICVAVLAMARGDVGNLVSPPPGTLSPGFIGSFGLALVASLWAYKGWEAATFSAGEMKNPAKDVPLGLFVGTLLVIFLYVLANLAYMYVFPVSHIAGSDRIASDVMNVVVGPIGASIIAFVILFSIAGAANGVLLTSPRVYFAMARDGLFFGRIARIHPKNLTPHVSIAAMGAWAAVLSLTGTFEQLFTYVIFGQWIFFGLAAAAVIVLRRKRPDLPRPYRTWGYPVTPLLFIAAALFISLNTLMFQLRDSLIGLGIILLGAPAYLYWRSRRGDKPHDVTTA